jgi:O-antigen ligase
MGLYLAIILILLFETETEHGRTGGELNSNTIGTMATVLCMLLYLKYYKHQLKALWFIILISLPIFTIISTGSRTAFGGLALLLGLHFFINRSRNVLITISKIVLPALILILAFNYLLENTGLGERILSTTEQSEGMDFETGNPILDKFGDRGIFYYRGWEVFIEQPLTGIGLGNFKDYNENKLAQHSEYMIQLTELGLIGFTLFFLFYLSIFKNLFRIKNILINKRENELFIGYVLIILLMITATRMYQVGYFFAIIGVTIGYFTKQKFLIQRVKIKN